MEKIIYNAGRKRSGKYVSCETCNKEFYVTLARIRQVEKQGNHIRFCSMVCYRKEGNLNPFWGKKHSEETKQKFSENPNRVVFKKGSLNPNFTRYNEETFVGGSRGWWQSFLKRKVGKCEACGYDRYLELLELHHIDRNRENNVRTNLKLFCPNCHEEWHLIDKSGRYTYKNEKRKK